MKGSVRTFANDLNGNTDPRLVNHLNRIFEMIYQLQEQQTKTPDIVKASLGQIDWIGLFGPLGQNLLGFPSNPDPQLQNLTNGTVTSVGTATDATAAGFSLLGVPNPILGSGTITFSISNAANARASLGVKNLLLATTTLDLNTSTKQALYTVPAGKSAVILAVVLRGASTNLSLGVTTFLTFGFNAGANDWSTTSNFPTPPFTSSSLYQMQGVEAAGGALPVVIGMAAQVFGGICDAAFGSAATITAEIYGNEW